MIAVEDLVGLIPTEVLARELERRAMAMPDDEPAAPALPREDEPAEGYVASDVADQDDRRPG